jgi:hypothetical protein
MHNFFSSFPGGPPPNIPIPGEPTIGGESELSSCKICGKSFNSKDELELHIKTDHSDRKK